jgi:hypothetical protein
MDKKTEQTVKAIYGDISKGQLFLDWQWVKREAESLLAGNAPNGTVGKSVQEAMQKAGLLPVAK